MGTSKDFVSKPRTTKKQHPPRTMGSDSEDSYNSSSRSSHGHGHLKSHRFTSSTPPPTYTGHHIGKRRKGIPHRAPMCGLVIEYWHHSCLGVLHCSSIHSVSLLSPLMRSDLADELRSVRGRCRDSGYTYVYRSIIEGLWNRRWVEMVIISMVQAEELWGETGCPSSQLWAGYT